MRSIVAVFAAILVLAATPPTLTGTWQGVIDAPNGKTRRVMEITSVGGHYHVAIHSLDETDVPITTDNVLVRGANVTMQFDLNTAPWVAYQRTYTATLSADGTRLSGPWKGPQGFSPIATTYVRVAKASWPIVEPRAQMVEVQPGVRVEALDWGGSGRAMLLLAGAGNTGHDFFPIVAKLRDRYHVYSMTRRGFGASSVPEATVANYAADRLGDDVVAVMSALHIVKPILVGHSLGGEELSDIGTRYRSSVAALIYLDAGYYYAIDSGYRPPWATATPPPGVPPMPPVMSALLAGVKAFKGPIDLPILSIYAYPHDVSHMPQSERTPERIQALRESDERAIAGFKAMLPNAKVIDIPHADHFLYLSNPDEVLRDMNAFIDSVPRN